MEKLLYLLIIILASSSIISAGNDTNFLLNTTPLSKYLYDSNTATQTSSEISVSPTTHHDHVVTSNTIKTVVPTTADLLSPSNTTGATTVPDGNRLSSNNTSERQINISGSELGSETHTVATQHTVSSLTTRDISGNVTPTAPITMAMSEVTATPGLLSGNSLTTLAFGVMSLILILIVVMVILVTTINLRGRCRTTKQQEGIKNLDSIVSDSSMTNNCEKENITLVSVRTINTDYDTDSPQVSSVRSTIVDNEDQEVTRDLLSIKDGF